VPKTVYQSKDFVTHLIYFEAGEIKVDLEKMKVSSWTNESWLPLSVLTRLLSNSFEFSRTAPFLSFSEWYLHLTGDGYKMRQGYPNFEARSGQPWKFESPDFRRRERKESAGGRFEKCWILSRFSCQPIGRSSI